MAKKCIYCSSEISDDSVIDFCKRCGVGVWGEKMFNTIVDNMESARSNGDLCHDRKEDAAFDTLNKQDSLSVNTDFQTNFK
jgi:hypothetical protein